MEDSLDSYRKVITDNFSLIDIGHTKLCFREDVYEASSRNLNFIFEDTLSENGIRLFVVVTFNFRFAKTTAEFIKNLNKAIDGIQLKKDCVYVIAIVTDPDVDNNIFNYYKEKFKDEKVFFLP